MKHTRQQTALTLVGTLLAIFLAALDQTVVATAGPAIQRALHVEAAWYAWLTTSYLVASTVLVPVWLRMPSRAPVAERGGVDLVGVLLLALGVVPLLLAASLGRTVLREGDPGYLWTSPQVLLLAVTTVVGLAAFGWWELRAPFPLVDLRLFRGRTFAAGNVAAFFLGGVFLTPMVFLPLFMVNVVGVTHTASGLTITPLILGVVAGNLVSGQAVSRLGRFKPLMLVALALMLGGLALMAVTLGASSTQAEVTVKMVLLGLGLGPALPLYTLAVQGAVPPAQLGVATSMTAFCRLLGSTIGVALVGSVFASTLSGELTERLAEVAKGLPPQVAQRLTQGRSADENDPAGPVFDAAKLRVKLADQLDGARAVAVKALAGDSIAAALVERSPFADEALRAAVAEGGVPARVQARVVALRQRAGAPLEDASVPEKVRRDFAEAKSDDALAAAEAAWVALELTEETAKVDASVTAARATLSRALDDTERAFKEAFAQASREVYWWAMAMALLALVATLLMREGQRPPK